MKEEEENRLLAEASARAAMLNSIPDALSELSEQVSSNAVDAQTVMDALAELSETVSDLASGKDVSNG